MNIFLIYLRDYLFPVVFPYHQKLRFTHYRTCEMYTHVHRISIVLILSQVSVKYRSCDYIK